MTATRPKPSPASPREASGPDHSDDEVGSRPAIGADNLADPPSRCKLIRLHSLAETQRGDRVGELVNQHRKPERTAKQRAID